VRRLFAWLSGAMKPGARFGASFPNPYAVKICLDRAGAEAGVNDSVYTAGEAGAEVFGIDRVNGSMGDTIEVADLQVAIESLDTKSSVESGVGVESFGVAYQFSLGDAVEVSKSRLQLDL